MWNICWRCGAYRVDKIVDPQGPVAMCPECGHRHPFRQLPLLLVSGASGVGKSTVCQALLGALADVVLLDTDILWRPDFNTPADNYRAFFRDLAPDV
jgi:DNA-directed RNA polymerase subunit RPC12/RpoP